MADGLATDNVDVHYNMLSNNCSAVKYQNGRILYQSFLIFICLANVNNCKRARWPPCFWEVHTVEEIAHQPTVTNYYTWHFWHCGVCYCLCLCRYFLERTQSARGTLAKALQLCPDEVSNFVATCSYCFYRCGQMAKITDTQADQHSIDTYHWWDFMPY